MTSISIKYLDEGVTVRAMRLDENSIKDTLPTDVYSIGFHQMEGFFLKKLGRELDTPSEIFGKTKSRIDKVMTSYKDSDSSFGVLFSGDKGSGKTMQAKLIAQRAMNELDIPVVMIEDSFDPAGLSEFIQLLGECVLFFDEFGKRFNTTNGGQDGLLSLFDGTGSSRRLILLTENNTRQINDYMLNRPGRVHYHFRHNKLDEDIIRELCDARKIPSDVIEKICLIRESSLEFSFDSLQAIVREYLRFPSDDITGLSADLNIEQPSSFGRDEMEIVSVENFEQNVNVEIVHGDVKVFPTNEFSPYIIVKMPDPSLDVIEDEDDRRNKEETTGFHLSIRDIVKRDGDTFVFVCEDDYTFKVVAKRKKPDYTRFLY